MSAAGVLFVMIVAWNVLNATWQFSRMTETMSDAARLYLSDDNGPVPEERPHKGKGGGHFDLMRHVSSGDLVILELDENGRILSSSVPEEAEALSGTASRIVSDGRSMGHADGWMYSLRREPQGIFLTLMNRAPLWEEILETALWSLLAFALAAALFAAVARLLARRIVAPAERSMTAQKRFIADASHELKTPLTVIDANAAVLEKAGGKSPWLDYIREQTARMSALVTALLTLSRIEEESETGADAPAAAFDASEVLMETVLPFESAAFEQKRSLQTDAPDSLRVTGCAEDFRQITGILLDNALKHSAPGSEITLSLKKDLMKRNGKEIPAIVLKVENTGETIPAEALPHLFDRFYQADASRAHRTDSFGLGLSIARALTEKHRGRISVTSENGLTVFTVALPFG